MCYNLTVLNDNMVDVLQHVSNCEHNVVSLHLNFKKNGKWTSWGGGVLMIPVSELPGPLREQEHPKHSTVTNLTTKSNFHGFR
jgi:hypothetical protein